MATVQLRDFEVDHLPAVCMKCGERADMEKWQDFSWYPPWLNALLLAGVGALPLLIVVWFVNKRMNVYVPLCRKHRNHWLRHAAWPWLGLAAIGILGFIGYHYEIGPSGHARYGGMLCLGWAVLLVVFALLTVIVKLTRIRPVEITDRTITLTNVAMGFVEALERRDEKYRRRVARRQGRYDDDRDRP